MAQIAKPARVIGRTVVFRNATVADAEFIVGLRTNPLKGRYLSATPPDVTAQELWLAHYALDPNQVYFIIEDMDGERFGTVRLYHPVGESFEWGSWILRDGRPRQFAMESALMVYALGLHFGFKRANLSVRKLNEKVWRFQERIGAKCIGEAFDDYFYEVSEADMKTALEQYRDFLPGGITITA